MFGCLHTTDIAKRYSHPPKDVSPDSPLGKGDSESSEDNDIVTTLTEKLVTMPSTPQLADDLTEIEEQYIAAEYSYQHLTPEEKVSLFIDRSIYP